MPKKKKKKKTRLCIFEKLPCTTIRVTEAIGEDDVATKSLENRLYMLQFYIEKKKKFMFIIFTSLVERERERESSHT